MTKIWGHRGAKGYYPENTLVSFEGAMKQKVDGIELDVHLSKDGYLVVCHDETLNRTTNGKGFIKDHNLYEIKQLDAGSWFDKKYKGEKIPLLEEVIEQIKGTDIDLNIEIKAGSIFYPGIEEKIVKIINKSNIKTQALVSSFDHKALQKIKQIDSTIKTGVLYTESLYRPSYYVEKLNINAINPLYSALTKEDIEEANKLNIDINTYTINLTEQVNKLKEYNINSFITDIPDIIKRSINNKFDFI